MGGDIDWEDVPDTRTGQIRYSVTNLWDEFGHTEHLGLALVVNCGLAALGALVWWRTSGIVAFVGFVWMLINLLGVVKWVIEG